MTQNKRETQQDPPTEGSDQPESGDTKRKERVLHTRVPAVLESELKKLADGLRIPVSNLVRTLLEDAVAIADRATHRVEDQLRGAADRVSGERERMRKAVAARDPLEGVYGFQPLVMNVHSTCAKCLLALAPGDDANLGLSDRPGPRMFICPGCLPGRKPNARNTGEPS